MNFAITVTTTLNSGMIGCGLVTGFAFDRPKTVTEHDFVYCLLTIHKTYNIYKGEEGLIKTIDTPLPLKCTP